jgi:hypothetical protein
LNDRLKGAPVTHAKFAPVIVPLTAVPAEPFTAVPEPSSRDQRATRPGVATSICAFAVLWISP